MISLAGQLGTGALTSSLHGESRGLAVSQVRSVTTRPSMDSQIGNLVISSAGSLGAGLRPAVDVGVSPLATTVRVGSFTRAFRYGFSDPAAGLYSLRSESLGSADFSNPDWFQGSFARAGIPVRFAVDVDTLFWAPPRPVTHSEIQATMSPTPYISVIWSLVQAQQLAKARALLKLVRDDIPGYASLKRLLSAPMTSVSVRK